MKDEFLRLIEKLKNPASVENIDALRLRKN